MTNDTGPSGGIQKITDNTAQAIGEQILAIMRSSRLSVGPATRSAAAPTDLGRIVHAFLNIRDPRVRSELLSLIEAVSSTSAG